MSPRTAGLLAIVLGAAACAPSERVAQTAAAADTTPDPFAVLAAEEPQPALFGCLVGDSAVYGDVRVDPESGDTVGVTLTFWRSGIGVYGTSILVSGGRADTVPFARVQLAGTDSVMFDTPHPLELDTIRFIGRVDCNRVWGRQRNRRESPSRPALYRRLYNADVAPSEPVP